jgi:hypothetical protein
LKRIAIHGLSAVQNLSIHLYSGKEGGEIDQNLVIFVNSQHYARAGVAVTAEFPVPFLYSAIRTEDLIETPVD